MKECPKCNHILQWHAIISQEFKIVRFDCGERGCKCSLDPEEYKILANV